MFLIVVPAVLLAVGLMRFSLALAGSLISHGHHRRPPYWLDGVLRDLIAQVSAKRIGKPDESCITLARMRDLAGQTIAVRFEGHFESGAVSSGDQISVRLRRIKGVNVVVSGENHTTREPIRLRR
jgi:hypothetical protein